MPSYVWRYIDSVVNAAGALEREHWIAMSVIVLIIGLICMRGFGSRSNY
jgi:hypothetical protein